jgi:hypothetical protein
VPGTIQHLIHRFFEHQCIPSPAPCRCCC